jgi:hypothetical protein
MSRPSLMSQMTARGVAVSGDGARRPAKTDPCLLRRCCRLLIDSCPRSGCRRTCLLHRARARRPPLTPAGVEKGQLALAPPEDLLSPAVDCLSGTAAHGVILFRPGCSSNPSWSRARGSLLSAEIMRWRPGTWTGCAIWFVTDASVHRSPIPQGLAGLYRRLLGVCVVGSVVALDSTARGVRGRRGMARFAAFGLMVPSQLSPCLRRGLRRAGAGG